MPPSSPPPRIANAYGFIRFALAGMVVVVHAHYLSGSAWDPLIASGLSQVGLATLAVAAFFALSGMLVTPSYLRSGRLIRFGWHRVLRIYPALIITLLLTVLVLIPLSGFRQPDGMALSSYLPTAAEYFGKNLLVPNALPRVPGAWTQNPASDFANGSLWTLRYELAGYVIIGVLGLSGLLRKAPIAVAAGFALACLVAIHDATMTEPTARWFFRSLGKSMILIALGGVVWATLRPSVREFLARGWRVALLAVTAAALCPTNFWPVGIALAAPPILHFLGQHLPARDWEKRVGGDYSYGIYILHYPVQQCLLALGWDSLSPWAFFGLSSLIVLPCAVLLWHAVEKPALSCKSWTPARFASPVKSTP